MRDVKDVFQTCRSVMACMIVLIIFTGLMVSRKPDSLPGFLRSLIWGSSLTLFLIILIGIGILTGFDAFFEGFHHIFFTGDSWLFYDSDSLIRLFPEPLWVNGFGLAAALTAVIALIVLVICLLCRRKVLAIREKIKTLR